MKNGTKCSETLELHMDAIVRMITVPLTDCEHNYIALIELAEVLRSEQGWPVHVPDGSGFAWKAEKEKQYNDAVRRLVDDLVQGRTSTVVTLPITKDPTRFDD